MSIGSVSPVSFKGYVPVYYMAKNPANDKYVQVIKKENIRKCHGFVVRNLNGTAKRNKNEDFVEFYKSCDTDYRRNPVVHSIYDDKSPTVYMVTGNDTAVVKDYARPVGIAKGEALDAIGRAESYESHIATKNFYQNVKAFLKGSCKRLKSQDGKNLSLVVFFNPQYTRNDKLKGFEFVNARFVEE